MPPQALGDGKGTAKAFLEDIASQESEAERSLMHRWVTGKASSECSRFQGQLYWPDRPTRHGMAVL